MADRLRCAWEKWFVIWLTRLLFVFINRRERSLLKGSKLGDLRGIHVKHNIHGAGVIRRYGMNRLWGGDAQFQTPKVCMKFCRLKLSASWVLYLSVEWLAVLLCNPCLLISPQQWSTPRPQLMLVVRLDFACSSAREKAQSSWVRLGCFQVM